MKKQISASELVNSHKPKNLKFFYHIKDEQFMKELENEGYDMTLLNTFDDDALTQAALHSDFTDEYDRDVVKRAKVPTIIGDGILISKQMITKADKKLQKIVKSIFVYNSHHYVAFKLQYEKFDIIQVFVLC